MENEKKGRYSKASSALKVRPTVTESLWLCYLVSEATVTQSFRLIKDLVVLQQQLLIRRPLQDVLNYVLDSLASMKMVVFLRRIMRNTSIPVTASDLMHQT